jgi:hypothetical protein
MGITEFMLWKFIAICVIAFFYRLFTRPRR